MSEHTEKVQRILLEIGRNGIDYVRSQPLDNEYLKKLEDEDEIRLYLLTGVKERDFNEEYEEEYEETKPHKMMYGYETPTYDKYYQ